MRTPTFVIATLLGTTAVAAAERVGVVVTGEATVQPQLASQLESWLEAHGRQVVPGPLEPEAINTLIDCFVLENLECARGVVDTRSKAKAVVFTRAEAIQNSDGTRDVAITGYWFQKNRDVLSERRVCTKCNAQSLHATLDDLMLALVHDPPPPSPGTPPLRSAPAPVAEERATSWKPLALMGVGGVAVLGGLVMILVDEDANPVGPQQPTFRDTATGGVVLGVTGAAVLGAGYYLWRRDKQSAPVAAVSSDGGYVGWAGRF